MKTFAFALSMLASSAALAQTPAAPPSAILVLDASGSMWGQIDGINKIVIAREVVAGLLADLPADLALGLTTYGHRRRGDCRDIETLIEPGLNNRDAIAQAVQALNPRGRTPMTQAVVEAARALRFTEEAATVILVSDGIETCEADPCAIAAELEAAGIGFTAHVVGFDVASEPEARAQMQCIAENTGGRFLTADNAEELAAALTEVTALPPATPAPEIPAPVILTTVTFSATVTLGDATRSLDDGVVFEVFQGDAIVMDATQTASPSAALPAGDYVLRAYRLSSETSVETPFTVTGAGDMAVVAAFADALPPATLTAPASGGAGSSVMVAWQGPNAEGDYIAASQPGSEALSHETYAWTRDGNPLALRLPAQPGDYVIRYILADAAQVLAEIPVTVTAQQQALDAPETATIGATIQVAWQGGGFDDDYLDIAVPGADAGSYLTYAYVRDGNPLDLQLPLFPGTYELRYITGQDLSVFARRTIEITDVPATLTAPGSAQAGGSIDVAWTGAGLPRDYIAIVTPGDGPNGYVTYAYIDGQPKVSVAVPDTPGTYELRYVAEGSESRVMVSQPLVVN